MKIAVFPGDGIGSEVAHEAMRVLEALEQAVAGDEQAIAPSARPA